MTENENVPQEQADNVTNVTEGQTDNTTASAEDCGCENGVNSIEGEPITDEFVETVNEKVDALVAKMGEEITDTQSLFDVISGDYFTHKEMIYLVFGSIHERFQEVSNPMAMLAQMLGDRD